MSSLLMTISVMSAPGDVVAVSLPNIPHHLVPVLGSIHAGRAFQSQSKTGGIPVLKIWIRTLYLQPKVLCKFLLHILSSAEQSQTPCFIIQRGVELFAVERLRMIRCCAKSNSAVYDVARSFKSNLTLFPVSFSLPLRTKICRPDSCIEKLKCFCLAVKYLCENPSLCNCTAYAYLKVCSIHEK